MGEGIAEDGSTPLERVDPSFPFPHTPTYAGKIFTVTFSIVQIAERSNPT